MSNMRLHHKHLQPLTYSLYLTVSPWCWLKYNIKTTLPLWLDLGQPEQSSQQSLCTDWEPDVLDSSPQQWRHNTGRPRPCLGSGQTEGVVVAILQGGISVKV